MELFNRLSRRIFAYRSRHNISQSKMAELLGVYTNMIWRLESGRRIHMRTAYHLMAKLDELERSDSNV